MSQIWSDGMKTIHWCQWTEHISALLHVPHINGLRVTIKVNKMFDEVPILELNSLWKWKNVYKGKLFPSSL